MKKVFKYTFKLGECVYYDKYTIDCDDIGYDILNENEYELLECEILPNDILYYVGVDGHKNEYGVVYETKNNCIVILGDGSLDNVPTSVISFTNRNLKFIDGL